MRITNILSNDRKSEVWFTVDEQRIVIRSHDPEPALQAQLQYLKPLLLHKCELPAAEAHAIRVTQIKLGLTTKGGLHCRLIGERRLQRGTLKLQTARMAFRRQFSADELVLLHETLAFARDWVHRTRAAQERSKHEPPFTVTHVVVDCEQDALIDVW